MLLAGGISARGNYTDKDIVNFLGNVECLEGQFDTFGTFGFGFVGEHSQLTIVTALCISAQ